MNTTITTTNAIQQGEQPLQAVSSTAKRFQPRISFYLDTTTQDNLIMLASTGRYGHNKSQVITDLINDAFTKQFLKKRVDK